MTNSWTRELALAAAAAAAIAGCADPQTTSTLGDPGTAISIAPEPQPPFIGVPLLTAPPESAQRTLSGVAFAVIGGRTRTARARPHDGVTLSYSLWRSNGVETMLDRAGVEVSELPAPISEVVSHLGVGEAARTWIPVDQAGELGGSGRTGCEPLPSDSPGEPPPAPAKPSPGQDDCRFAVVDLAVHGLVRRPALPDAPPGRAPEHAARTESGLAYELLHSAGSEHRARPWDRMSVRYSAFTPDGDLIASNATARLAVVRPASLSPGWTEALQLIGPGDRAVFWIPAAATDHERSPEVVDIEVVKITEWPQPPAPPADLAPPAGARVTGDGIRFEVLEPGDGEQRVTKGAHVVVEYTAYALDGRVVDSSVIRGRPTYFTTDAVFEGLEEALTTMVTGQRARFWIPAAQTGDGGEDAERGELMFDVKLVAVWGGRTAAAAPAATP